MAGLRRSWQNMRKQSQASSSFSSLAFKTTLLVNVLLFILYTRCQLSHPPAATDQQISLSAQAPAQQATLRQPQAPQTPEARSLPRYFIPHAQPVVLRPVKDVLMKRGWVEHAPDNNGEYKAGAKLVDDWDLFWAYYDYYVYVGVRGVAVKPHQRVNHFKGHGRFVSKGELWFLYSSLQKTFGKPEFNFLPVHFMLPEQKSEFHKFVAGKDVTQPGNRWLFKSRAHKGIQVVQSHWEIYMLISFLPRGFC